MQPGHLFTLEGRVGLDGGVAGHEGERPVQQRHRLALARAVDVLHQRLDEPTRLLAAEQGRHRAQHHGGAAPPLEAEAQALEGRRPFLYERRPAPRPAPPAAGTAAPGTASGPASRSRSRRSNSTRSWATCWSMKNTSSSLAETMKVSWSWPMTAPKRRRAERGRGLVEEQVWPAGARWSAPEGLSATGECGGHFGPPLSMEKLPAATPPPVAPAALPPSVRSPRCVCTTWNWRSASCTARYSDLLHLAGRAEADPGLGRVDVDVDFLAAAARGGAPPPGTGRATAADGRPRSGSG